MIWNAARRARPRLLGTILILSTLLVAASSLGPSAVADTTSKPAYVNVSPGTASPGSLVKFTVTIKNGADNQQLGSANIAPPSGFTVTSATADRGDTPPPGNTVHLRNLSLVYNDTVTATIQATTPCSAVTGDAAKWTIIVKQANDFNGNPGNDFFVVPTTNISTEISSGCHLKFTTQPASAKVGTTITGDAYGSLFTPPSTTYVKVAIVDGSGNVLTSASANITLTIQNASVSSTAPTGTLPQPTSSGVAAFNDIAFGTAGLGYTLTACDTSCDTPGPLGTITSTPFNLDDNVTVCTSSSTTCTSPTTTSNGSDKTKVQITGNNATQNNVVTLSFNLLSDLHCNGYTAPQEPKDSVATFNYTGTGTKVVTIMIDKAVVNAVPNNGASFFQVCFAANDPFTTKDGTYTQGTMTDPATGGTLYTGVLPDCPSKPQTGNMPCVLSKNKDKAGNVVLKFIALAGDPHAR